MNKHILFQIAILVAVSIQLHAGLIVSKLKEPPKDAIISYSKFDPSGNTSVQFLSNKDLKYDEVLDKYLYRYDRDLGQTFTVGYRGFILDAGTVKTGLDKHAKTAHIGTMGMPDV